MTRISAGPAWYVDEEDSAIERYWNGSRWSDQTRPASGTAGKITDVHAAPLRVEPDGYEQSMLKLATRSAVAAERTATYVLWLLAITVVLLVAGVAIGLYGVHGN